MPIVNTVYCKSDSANTGIGECPVHTYLEGLIEVPASAEFTELQLLDLVTYATGQTKNANSSLRFYPFPEFIGGEMTGGDPNFVDFDNGGRTVTWENDLIYTGRFYNPGVIINNALRARNGSDVYFIGFGKGYAFGAKKNGKYKGFKGKSFWALAQVPGAFKVESKYSFTFNINPKDMNEDYWYVKADGIESLQGLKSLKMLPVNTPVMDATGLVVVDLKHDGYGTDYIALYPAIGGLTYTAKNAAGLPITVTGASINGAGKLAIDLDIAINFPIVGGTLTITGPLITALETAGVLGAEILPLTVTRTV